MALFVYILALCVAFTSAIPSYIIPAEHRSLSEVEPVQVVQQYPHYEYLVPNPEYYDTALMEYYKPTHLSVWNYIPSFKTAVTVVVSKVWAITKWVVAKASFVLLGVALVVGVCAFTPFCTLTFKKHSYLSHAYRSIMESSTLDQIQDFVYQSIEKFKNYQDEKSD